MKINWLLFSLFILNALAFNIWGQTTSDANLTAREIVRRFVDARGGMQKIMAIRTLILRGEGGEGENPMRPGRVMTRARPYYLLVGDPQKKATADFAEGNDGSHWEFYSDPGLIIRPTGAPANAIRHTAYFDDALTMSAREQGWKVVLMGKETVAGHETYRLHITYPDSFESDFFIDSKSWLVVANRWSTPIHAFGGAVRSETRWLDWREVNGVLFPTLMQEVEIATNKILDRGRWTSIEANVELSPATFSPPQITETPLMRMLNAAYAARLIPTDALGWYLDFRSNLENKGVDTQVGMASVGYQILKTGAVETAILLLEANVKDNPKSAMAHFGLGRAYRTAGREAEAITMFRKALEIDPNYKRAADALKQPPSGMVLIQGATFEMGTDKAAIPKLQEIFNVKRAELFTDETPKHKVTIDSFYIDRFEVTNADFKKFLDRNPTWRKDKIAADFHNGKYLQDWTGSDFPPEKADYPVVDVSWYAAVAYCQSLGKRLPTEAEWEYAARGGLTNKQFPWGDEMTDKTRANFGASGLGAPTKVGSYPANGYGLFDMAGNVWEFLADEWRSYPTSNETQINPVAGGDFFQTNSYQQVKTRRAIRGGSYGGAPINLRITFRDSHLPNNAVDHVGFRCAQGITGLSDVK